MDAPRRLLEQFGYRPKKRLGQNFLADAAAASRIAVLVLASTGSAVLRRAQHDTKPLIVEIGPGTGALTRALVDAGADVTAVDVDEHMIEILRSQPALANATIVHADALTVDYDELTGGRSWRMAGNLPYNVATPLVMRFIEMGNGPELLVVMVQKEVADRFAARPATPQYGSLSIAVQYAMTVERAFTLRPAAFYPRPKIDSSVVVLRRREAPAVRVRDERHFLQVVRGAFAYRRKTAANSLALALDTERAVIERALQQAQLPTEIRGEQLAIADFARLADALSV